MRGKLTDQDLTNYALNELDPHQRLYVESMLAVSVECRNDVYEMLEVAQLLEDGFEQQANGGSATLTAIQRAELTKPRRRVVARTFFHKMAASVAIAACAAFAFANSNFLSKSEGARKVAEVSSQMTQMVVGPATEDVDIASWVNLESYEEETSDWLQAASDALPQPAVVCTPPSWLDNSDVH